MCRYRARSSEPRVSPRSVSSTTQSTTSVLQRARYRLLPLVVEEEEKEIYYSITAKMILAQPSPHPVTDNLRPTPWRTPLQRQTTTCKCRCVVLAAQALSIGVPNAQTSTHLESDSASHRGAAASLLDLSERRGGLHCNGQPPTGLFCLRIYSITCLHIH